MHFIAVSKDVSEVHPLKEGLRHASIPGDNTTIGTVSEVHPLKEGLRLVYLRYRFNSLPVSEVHPLEEGLRRGY